MFACLQKSSARFHVCRQGHNGRLSAPRSDAHQDEIFSGFLGEFEESKTFFHGHTYTGNPVACAVALANLELFEKEGVIEKVRKDSGNSI